MRRWCVLLALLSAAVVLCGCDSIIGFPAAAIGGPGKVPAAYTLPDRPTLVLVDDPTARFSDPNLALVVAANVEHHLKFHEVLTAPLVPTSRLADLQAKAGDDYAAMPVDQIGRELGAQQVIYVLIDAVSLQDVPGVYKPSATAQVKVIDTATGRRLFPDPPAPNQPASSTPVRGQPVAVELKYKGADVGSRGAVERMKRTVAEVLGRDVARLFYKWSPPEPGYRFDEP